MYFYCMSCLFCFFFFQAEDGIRDRNVTGVQTCALPISSSAPPTLGATLAVFKQHTDQVTTVAWAPNNAHFIASGSNDKTVQIWNVSTLAASARHAQAKQRSEERRVGKECRARRAQADGR